MNQFRASHWLAISWLFFIGMLAFVAPALPLPYPPATPDLAHLATPPMAAGAHWLGTDPLGRDVLAELVFGTRTAIELSLPAAALVALAGALLGGAAGFWGNHQLRWPWPSGLVALGLAWWGLALPIPNIGLAVAGLSLLALAWAAKFPRQLRWHMLPLPLDALVLGTTTLLGAVPRLVLVVALAAALTLSPAGLLAILVLTTWPASARLVRAEMLRTKTLPFVEAARALGLSPLRIWWGHALRHASQPLRTAFPLSLAGLLGLESTLSFLGVGLPPEVPSWGHLLSTARLEPSAWWLVTGPGGLLLLTILSLQHLARAR